MEPFMGQIELFPFNFVPQGWSTCEGQLLAISQNMALFSLIGTTFGGDGQSNFALPNLQGKAPGDGLAYYIALQGIYPPRQ
jgi:microcystin-dependent protein